MTYTVFATNRPEEPLEVDEAELIDLSRQGLLILGKGDINRSGRLRKPPAEDLPEGTLQALNDTFLPDATTDTATGQGA